MQKWEKWPKVMAFYNFYGTPCVYFSWDNRLTTRVLTIEKIPCNFVQYQGQEKALKIHKNIKMRKMAIFSQNWPFSAKMSKKITWNGSKIHSILFSSAPMFEECLVVWPIFLSCIIGQVQENQLSLSSKNSNFSPKNDPKTTQKLLVPAPNPTFL